MYRAVLFDLDHTLYSKEATLSKMAPDLLEYLDLNWDLSKFTHALIQADYCLYTPSYVYQGPIGIYRELCKTIPMPPFEKYEAFIMEKMGSYASCYPFTVPVLENCRSRRLKLGILTNGKESLQSQKLSALGISPYFDTIVTAGDRGILKPDPKIFLSAAHEMDVLPEETIFVGDNPLDDISGAKYACMAAVWIRQPLGYPANLPAPDWEINSIKELPDLLDRLS